MDVADILERAAVRLSKPGAWTQGSYARTVRGHRIGPCCGPAVCWCAEGALIAESDSDEAARQALEATLPPPPEGARTIPHWNDTAGRTQSEVVQALRDAAAKARDHA